MRIALLATAWPLWALADPAPSPLTFSYQTFTQNTVETATTVYPLAGKAHHHHHHSRPAAPTSYTPNPADIAYPSFPSVNGTLANNAPGPGLPNATVLAGEAGLLIEQFKVPSAANCLTCQKALAGVAARMKVQQETLSDIATPFCQYLTAALPLPICLGLLKIASTDLGGIFPAM